MKILQIFIFLLSFNTYAQNLDPYFQNSISGELIDANEINNLFEELNQAVLKRDVYDFYNPNTLSNGDKITSTSLNQNLSYYKAFDNTIDDFQPNNPISKSTLISNLNKAIQAVRENVPAISCEHAKLIDSGAQSGVYALNPDGNGIIKTYCDMDNQYALVFNNTNNTALDLTNGDTTELSNFTQKGSVGLDRFATGSTQYKWTFGTTGENTILEVQEQGSAFTSVYYTWSSPTGTTAPSGGLKYVWNILYTDPDWSNDHGPSWTHGNSGWNDYGDVVVNYVAGGDCNVCYSPHARIFGNGRSGYYNYGSVYDYDSLASNGTYTFNDKKPSFIVSINQHQLWAKSGATIYIDPKDCQMVVDRRAKNTDGNYSTGTFVIDSDGYNKGNAPTTTTCTIP